MAGLVIRGGTLLLGLFGLGSGVGAALGGKEAGEGAGDGLRVALPIAAVGLGLYLMTRKG